MERSEHRLHPAPPATDRQLVCFRTRRSSANEQLVATQLLTETMQGVMPTVGLPPVTENALGGTAAAPSSAPVAGAFEPSSTHCGLPEAPHQPLSVAQGPILPPSLYAAPAVPSAPAGSGCSGCGAGSSTDPPPQPAADSSSSSRFGSRAGEPLDSLGLSAQLRSLLQAQVDALQPLVHASQQVATSFVRELAPLMQMQQRPLPAAAAEQPPDPASALQARHGETPMPQAVQRLQQLQQLQLLRQLQQLQQLQQLPPPPMQPPQRVSASPQLPDGPQDPAALLRRALLAQQAFQRPEPSFPGCSVPLQQLSASSIDGGVTAPMQDSVAAVPVQATVDLQSYASCTGEDSVTGEVATYSANAPAAAREDPSL